MRNALAGMDTEGRAKIEGNIDQKLEALGNNALAAVQDMLTGANRSKKWKRPWPTWLRWSPSKRTLSRIWLPAWKLPRWVPWAKPTTGWPTLWRTKRRHSARLHRPKHRKTKSKALKAAAQTTALVANVFFDAGAAANAEAALTVVNNGKSDFLKGLVKDLTGRVESNAQVYDLIKQVGQKVSKARQFYREQPCGCQGILQAAHG